MLNTLNIRAFLTAAAFAVVSSARAAAPATFNIVPRDFPAHLYTIAVGDFNHDGLLDIAGTDQKGNLVSVYLGTGGGTFGLPTTYQIGGSASHIAVADTNGDGNLDIVTADTYPGSISILPGNGNGTFGSPTIINVTGNPGSIAIGDVNGDGEPDIVVSDESGQISLLLSTPSHGFAPLTQIPGGGTPQAVRLADFNNDGKLDIAELDGFTGDTLILFGNGNGTFRTGPSTHVGYGPFSFAALDLNGDGFADLVVPNSDIRGALNVLLGQGDGTFQPVVHYPTADFPGAVAFGDFNGDGILDVIATSGEVINAGGATVLFGNGDGTFGAPMFSVAPIGAGSVAVGDFTGDGKLDAVIVSTNDVSILRGEGNGYFANPPSYNLAKNAVPIALASADFNGDGKADLVTATYLGTNSLWISLGKGDSTFQPAIEVPLDAMPLALTVADFNDDGKPDIVLTMNGGGTLYSVKILFGNGDGTFRAPVTISSSGGFYGLTSGDFNHDGKIDLALSLSDYVEVLAGNGDGTFQGPVNTRIPAGIDSLIIGDFNHDGNLDLAGTSQNAQLHAVVDVLIGNGDGTFQPPTANLVGKEATSVVAADFNGDGIVDLATANVGVTGDTAIPGTISVLMGNGNGLFQPAVSFFAGDNTNSIGAADLNGDGIVDLVAANFLDNNLGIFLGNGDGTFSPQVGKPGTGYQPAALVVADFNADGKPDIAVANQASISVLTNETVKP